MLLAAGFERVNVELKPESRNFIKDWLPGSKAEDYVVSANITAYKPHSPTATVSHGHSHGHSHGAAPSTAKPQAKSG